MWVEQSLNWAITNLQNIVKMNQYIREKIAPFIGDDHNFDLLLEQNYKADNILSNKEAQTIKHFLDTYWAFWIYEIAHSLTAETDQTNGLLNKIVALKGLLAKYPQDSFNVDLSELRKINTIYQVERTRYENYEEDFLIVTATPEEFKAVVRKLKFIDRVANKTEIRRVFNPQSTDEDLKKRKTVWIEGVFERENRIVKGKVLLTSQDGSLSTISSINEIHSIIGVSRTYTLPNEVVLVGIAGQLDKFDGVKIGHLVISDGFYNAYEMKFEEINQDEKIINTINYKDKIAKSLLDDYDCMNFRWTGWEPKELVVSLPMIKDMNIESKTIKVHKGKFVSHPAVNKQNFNKELLRNAYPDALAIEMEGSGCYTFLRNTKRSNLKIIKAVVDWADGTKNDNWHSYCADIAAEFTVDFLLNKHGKYFS